ncbi:cold-shock protein [Flammeovirga sp. EKP202]|uniref:cold-shock protein n=1 Tax=Flammeovirga sp. EKP202 TaxID=2770592 RepID=UPI00165F84A4|nr:cold shock domain-containing protein [Flammeovirga sp. EKP202]MBD0403654.1 cold shock domain-containing protein [Flammeovirga sp. EKP202]
MGRSQQTFNKLEKDKKKKKKREEKLAKKEEQKKNRVKGDLENMMAYVDEFGNITSTPPDPDKPKEKIKLEDIQISTSRQEDIEEQKRQGRVDYYNPDKKFGFIIEKGSRERYFFHISDVDEEYNIQEKDFVSFDLKDTPRGRSCIDITKAPKE